MMIIYEITATVNAELIDAYEKYMVEKHIPELLETGYFSQAFFARADKNRYQIQYHAFSQKDLDSYLENDAQRLREDFAQHFPDRILVSRENWQILQTFTK
ncbi:MAG: DUF4286 family protein [Pyrinomonadaceae bacterium]|jgi:hypothetical protein|nr:DUF4286 family protein [Pyrinomonadaceae bacterium]